MNKKQQGIAILLMIVLFSLSCNQVQSLISTPSSTPLPTPFPTFTPTPAPTPMGGSHWIAFSDELNGNRDVYIIKTDGSNKTRLTSNEDWDWSPTWSPDGKQIAFLSMRSGNSEIYIMDIDGSNTKRLTHNQSYEGYPAWSPDGKNIAFVSDRDEPDPAGCEDSVEGCNSNIYVIDIDSLDETRLTDASSDDQGPSWSPDGKHIVFFSTHDGNVQIFMMDSDGSHTTRLTNDQAYNWRPAWSPDGQHIAFMSYHGAHNQIYMMRLDDSSVTRLTNDLYEDSAPSWSPDGKHIAFQSSSSIGNARICILDLNGEDTTCLQNDLANAWEPVWQPLTTSPDVEVTHATDTPASPSVTVTSLLPATAENPVQPTTAAGLYLPFPGRTNTSGKLNTSIGILVITKAESVSTDITGNAPAAGYQILQIWFDGADGSEVDTSGFFDALEGVILVGDDGSQTERYSGGGVNGKLLAAFAPPAAARKFWLYWPGNLPVEIKLTK
jgi:Tol biopolymer transport system component